MRPRPLAYSLSSIGILSMATLSSDKRWVQVIQEEANVPRIRGQRGFNPARCHTEYASPSSSRRIVATICRHPAGTEFSSGTQFSITAPLASCRSFNCLPTSQLSSSTHLAICLVGSSSFVGRSSCCLGLLPKPAPRYFLHISVILRFGQLGPA